MTSTLVRERAIAPPLCVKLARHGQSPPAKRQDARSVSGDQYQHAMRGAARTLDQRHYHGLTSQNGAVSPSTRTEVSGVSGAPPKHRRRGADSGGRARLIDELTLSAPPPARARCLDPDCVDWCEWTTGNPRYFHDRSCLERYHRNRERLRHEIQVISAALATNPASSREGRTLRAHLARRRWLLARYPSLG